MAIERPTAKYVRDQLRESEGQDRYWGADPAVRLVFDEWPENTVPAHVLVKVTILNALYATNIFNVYPVADRILSLKLDERLRDGDETLVADVAQVKLGKKNKTLLSFASKYCAWHQPDRFQIFDSRVEYMLWEYRKAFAFADFQRGTLRDYPSFARIIGEFRDFFGLKEFTRKKIDKFLWVEGGK